MATTLVPWPQLASTFDDGLILGNGASIAVCPAFHYRTLRQHVEQRAPQLAALYQAAGSANAERALGWHRRRHPQDPLPRHQLRLHLLQALQQHHVSHATLAPLLPRLRRFLSRFRTVATLNYDAIARWAAACPAPSARPIGWQPDGDNTLLVFPHGQLSEHGSVVCAGSAAEKRRAIAGHHYLRQVYEGVLPNMAESLVIYGWSLGPQDRHIVAQLGRQRRLRRVAVAVYRHDPLVMRRAQRLFGNGRRELVFFDAESPGCWAQAEVEHSGQCSPHGTVSAM